ncbi:hypothetical protein SNL152K_2713 [Streptomyces sp. NL15-2K]|nr:hypothetical protein SNL152K_2713 [Streptomyces sp. NL15-2K]
MQPLPEHPVTEPGPVLQPAQHLRELVPRHRSSLSPRPVPPFQGEVVPPGQS